MRILVGFNKKSLCEILKKALKGEGEVACAANFEELLNNMQDFDVAVVEENFDGHNLIEAQTTLKDKKVILLVSSDEGLIVPYIKVDANFSVDKIRKKIQEVLGGKEPASQPKVQVQKEEVEVPVFEKEVESAAPEQLEPIVQKETEELSIHTEEKEKEKRPVAAVSQNMVMEEIRIAVREAVWDLLPEVLREVVREEVQKIIESRLAK